MLTVTKIFEFSAGHFLPDYDGKCRESHGHNFVLEVEVADREDIDDSVYPTMIIDFSDLKKIVEEKVIDRLDHKTLNDIIPIPTAESLVLWIAGELLSAFHNRLNRIRLYETSTSYAEWRRD